jgi:hypothetical protein
MSSPRHWLASILQTVLDEHAKIKGPPLELSFDKSDVKGVLKEVFARAVDVPKHPQGRPHSSKPTKLPDRARLFLVGDFGTGLYGAPVTAKTVEADPEKFDLLVHLGDVYYSGEKDEVQQRLLDIWPKRAEGTSRNLNGNHDMYSRGYGYFDVALPAFGQDSSYFAFQNSRWTLLFLDTS